MINPVTGEIKTVQGLDYERSKQHTLIIGTEQAMLEAESFNSSSSTCSVIVTVTDLNDIPPTFTRLPPGNRVQVKLEQDVSNLLNRGLSVQFRRGRNSDCNSNPNLGLGRGANNMHGGFGWDVPLLCIALCYPMRSLDSLFCELSLGHVPSPYLSVHDNMITC